QRSVCPFIKDFNMGLIRQQRYAVGVLTLFSVVLIWVGSSFLVNNIFDERQYNKPFAITYINTSSFSLYILFFIFKSKKLVNEQKNEDTLYETLPRSSTDSTNSNHDDDISKIKVAKLGFTFCIIWFAANWCTNASLAYTNVASSTILSSMSCFFTLVIGAFFGIEKFSLIKLVAVCVSVIGVILISTRDTAGSPQDQPIKPLIGDSLALIGAIFYGCYTVLLKLRIQNESRVDMPLFFGFVGLFNVILLWPGFFLLDILEIEKLQLPPNGTIWTMVIINALIGTFLSDYLWLLSILMTSPLVVTLGLSLAIPLALIGDIFFKGIVADEGYWLVVDGAVEACRLDIIDTPRYKY
ncbi:2825_t:CDS:2, partial [Entrophospora sp. SA101]